MIGDAAVGGQQARVLGSAQFADEFILLADGGAPIGQFGTGADAGEARGRTGVVQGLGSADQRL